MREIGSRLWGDGKGELVVIVEPLVAERGERVGHDHRLEAVESRLDSVERRDDGPLGRGAEKHGARAAVACE